MSARSTSIVIILALVAMLTSSGLVSGTVAGLHGNGAPACCDAHKGSEPDAPAPCDAQACVCVACVHAVFSDAAPSIGEAVPLVLTFVTPPRPACPAGILRLIERPPRLA